MHVAGEAARNKARRPRRRPLTKPRAASSEELPDNAESQPDPAALLAWYDRHGRVLPWRARPGTKPDPYRVWLSEIMLQQTGVKTVAPYFARFLARFPSVANLAEAPLEEVLKSWAGLGYYARARNLHACARAVMERHGGRFPDSEEGLRALPGIGPYTAAAIAAIAFDRRASPVDGNIERVIARLFAVDAPFPAAKPMIRQLAASLTPAARAGDFAQGLMDLGAMICTPVNPACILCPWSQACRAARRGDPERFPAKARKSEGRLRRGAAYVVLRDDGFVLLRRRPEEGLLGGMSEVPTTEWTHDFTFGDALAHAPRLFSAARQNRQRPSRWRRVAGTVTHTFTHFPLALVVYKTSVPRDVPAPDGSRWVALGDLDGEALPNVMRKVLWLAQRPPKMQAAKPNHS